MGRCSSVGRNKWPIFFLGLRNSGPNFFSRSLVGNGVRSSQIGRGERRSEGGQCRLLCAKKMGVGRSVDGTGEIGQKMGSFERDTSIFDNPPKKIRRAQNFNIDVRFFFTKKIKLAGRLFRMWQIDERRVYVYVCVWLFGSLSVRHHYATRMESRSLVFDYFPFSCRESDVGVVVFAAFFPAVSSLQGRRRRRRQKRSDTLLLLLLSPAESAARWLWAKEKDRNINVFFSWIWAKSTCVRGVMCESIEVRRGSHIRSLWVAEWKALSLLQRVVNKLHKIKCGYLWVFGNTLMNLVSYKFEVAWRIPHLSDWSGKRRKGKKRKG